MVSPGVPCGERARWGGSGAASAAELQPYFHRGAVSRQISGNRQLMVQRVLIEVSGIVQGVGFRPHVYSPATALDLRGFVENRVAPVHRRRRGGGLARHVPSGDLVAPWCRRRRSGIEYRAAALFITALSRSFRVPAASKMTSALRRTPPCATTASRSSSIRRTDVSDILSSTARTAGRGHDRDWDPDDRAGRPCAGSVCARRASASTAILRIVVFTPSRSLACSVERSLSYRAPHRLIVRPKTLLGRRSSARRWSQRRHQRAGRGVILRVT